MRSALDDARAALALIADEGDRSIVEEWGDRYRLLIQEPYDDAAILRLAVRLYWRGLIPQTKNAIIDWKGRRL